jgi:uncharacterized protein YkwD
VKAGTRRSLRATLPRRAASIVAAAVLALALLGHNAPLASAGPAKDEPQVAVPSSEQEALPAPLDALAGATLVLENPAGGTLAEAPMDPVSTEAQLVERINALRAEHGRRPLALDTALSDLARERSEDMVARGYFGHDIPGVGFAPHWLLSQLADARGAGENLGLSIEPNDRVVDSLFATWVASPSHRENMLRPQYSHVGVGTVEVPGPRRTTLKVITQAFAMAAGPLARRGR